jgi:hypothetical protein
VLHFWCHKFSDFISFCIALFLCKTPEINNPMRTLLIASLLMNVGFMAHSGSEESVESFFCPTDGLRTVSKLPEGFILSDSKSGQCLSCTTSALQQQKIIDNCVISQSQNLDTSVIRNVRRTCRRIACSPTWFQKWKYN